MRINFEFDTDVLDINELSWKLSEMQKIEKFIIDQLKKAKNEKLEENNKKFDEERNMRDWNIGV
jgi:hypothetical protein